METNFNLNELKQHTETLINNSNIEFECNGLFTLKTASQWIEQAKQRPIPKKLFDSFWYESEICILFADTNLGKSILAVQIGNSISKGEAINGFCNEAIKQPVLYFDFELSDKQFENRYSIDFKNHYSFDNNFVRVEINPNANIPSDVQFENYLSQSLEDAIISTGAKILIIDNLTYLKNETEKAKDALPLMKELKALKNKHDLSILVLAHTPKRDLSKPITRNDLSGSKMLINFCDSSFTIGESQKDKNIKYLKQIKVRQSENMYDSENVCVCQIHKPNSFLQFEFINYGTEREHLREVTESSSNNVSEKVIELKQKGLSYRDIGKELSISHMKAKRVFEANNNCNTL